MTDHPRTDWVVFGVTAAIMFGLVSWGVLATDSLSTSSQAAFSWMMSNLGWGFVLAATGFVVFALFLAFSRYGRIPLGQDGEKPEFRTISWIAMMFSAGMGIGLMFYGVSEPLSHFVDPPPGSVPGETDEAIKTAMATSLFHWTLHPWAIYAVAGLAIAYSSFRRGRKQLISAVFLPLIGKRNAEGPIGRLIDILALFATLFGSAASLGIGTLQIKSGMQAANWIGETGTTILVLIIVVLTICFIASAVSGVAKGIQWLSNINMVLAALLAVFVFVVGPTVFILNLLPTTLGSYLSDFGEMASRAGATGGPDMLDWLSSWTVFYWAWWISWTPFVGMFIARISRGRTIRQFIGGVLLVPSVVSLVWFAIFGGAAINTQQGGQPVYGDGSAEAQTFDVLAHMPLTLVTSVLVMVLVAIFFVSGADAASVVMGTLSQRGSIEPSKWVVIFWGAATGAVAAIMLVIGGGQETALQGIQNLTFIGALPFAIIMVLMCVALMRDLRSDRITLREEKGAEVLEQAVIIGTEEHDGDFQLEVSPAEPSENGDESEDDADSKAKSASGSE
ncbi:BCCT family transporter [Saccharopolyspora erythraea]|uniref:Glycine betaine transporter, BCCT family n=2 Tax=Saccharopolyspora erythraea TaxID=1836 RepID=A4F5V5_SACEN|nr:BCCT family transporter [Saccharopolyspora erythraea]EQD84208.1 choline transporter [Saccharopolyspora erythraea D]QRK90083.1 BCCT family transporter [Saccharopolyspora erythraea]CAL99429.1 glycine betaine transporter, BCCT family [Saccharopolyspora erythraea NRRL 2338]